MNEENQQVSEAQSCEQAANQGGNSGELIDHVPGVTDSSEESTQTTTTKVSMSEEEFKARGGDPSKVLGHPSNPNGQMVQAAADHVLGKDKPADISESLPEQQNQ